MSLSVTVAPTSEPVTVDEIKARLRITSTDDDSLIEGLIPTARELAEKLTGWSMTPKTYQDVRDGFPCHGDAIKLFRPPVNAVTAVEFLDGTFEWQTWDASEYYVAASNVPAVIVPKPGNLYPFPAQVPGSVRVTYTTGAHLYAPHLEGIRQLTAHLYEHPEAVNAENLKEMPWSIRNFFLAEKALCEF